MASIKKTALSSVSKVLRSIKDTMEAKKKATRTRKQVKGISDKAQELENTRPSYSRHPLGSTTDYDKSITGQRKGGVHQEVAEFDQQLTTSDALIDRNVNALIDLKKSAKKIKDIRKDPTSTRAGYNRRAEDPKVREAKSKLVDPNKSYYYDSNERLRPAEVPKKATRGFKKEVKKAFKKAIDRRRSLKE